MYLLKYDASICDVMEAVGRSASSRVGGRAKANKTTRLGDLDARGRDTWNVA